MENLSTATIEVFAKNRCVQCDATKRTFNKEGLVEGEHFNVTMLEDNEEALESLKKAGYLQAPIVFVKTTIETNKAVTEEENYSEENAPEEDAPEEDALEEKIVMEWTGFNPDQIRAAAALIMGNVGIEAPRSN